MSTSEAKTATVEQWFDALVRSANEFATRSLGLSGAVITKRCATYRPCALGGFVAVSCPDASFEIGVSSKSEECRKLATDFLGLPAAAELDDEEVVDAMGEIANILAGGVKRQMFGISGEMKLSLPVILSGVVRMPSSQNLLVADFIIGRSTAQLILLRQVA